MSKKRERREKARLKALEKEGLVEEEKPKEEVKPEEKPKEKKGFSLKYLYEKEYKKLLLIPLIILILAFAQIGYQVAATGDFLNKGISLKGGTEITIEATVADLSGIDTGGLKSLLLSEFPKSDVSVKTQKSFGELTGVIVGVDFEDNERINRLKNILVENVPGLTLEDVEQNIGTTGSVFGAAFFKQTFFALLLAFLFMAIVVFLYFRIVVPSIAVILCAFSDIVVTLAIVNLLGFKLSSAGIIAFLLLIGYSVDTDILLSTRMLKRKEGTVMDSVYSAMKTGLTMTGTTLAAVFIAMLFAQSEAISQIMLIVFIGLWVDLIMTWIQNTGILRWYLERKTKND